MQKRKLDIQKSLSELNAIIKEANKSFAEVLIAHSLTFDERNFVAAKMFKDFDELPKENKEFYYSIIKQVNDITPFVKEKEPVKPVERPTIETCGLCGLKSTSKELVKHIRFDPASELNYDYYYCVRCDNEIKEINKLSYKELTKQIRQILKSYAPKLSITNPNGWLEIGGSGGNYGELTDKETDVLNSFDLNYGNGLVRTSIKGSSLAFWLIKIKRIHAKNTPKRAIAKGSITSEGKITIQFNDEKEGIELIFPNKPEESVLIALKVLGFRWNNRGKLWYIKQSKITPEGENFIKSLL